MVIPEYCFEEAFRLRLDALTRRVMSHCRVTAGASAVVVEARFPVERYEDDLHELVKDIIQEADYRISKWRDPRPVESWLGLYRSFIKKIVLEEIRKTGRRTKGGRNIILEALVDESPDDNEENPLREIPDEGLSPEIMAFREQQRNFFKERLDEFCRKKIASLVESRARSEEEAEKVVNGFRKALLLLLSEELTYHEAHRAVPESPPKPTFFRWLTELIEYAKGKWVQVDTRSVSG